MSTCEKKPPVLTTKLIVAPRSQIMPTAILEFHKFGQLSSHHMQYKKEVVCDDFDVDDG